MNFVQRKMGTLVWVFLFGIAIFGRMVPGNAQSLESARDAGTPLERVNHGHVGKIVAWSAAGNLILTCGSDDRMLIREAGSGKLLLRYDLPTGRRILGATFSPGADKIAVVYREPNSGEIRLKLFFMRNGTKILERTIFEKLPWEEREETDTLHTVLRYEGNTVCGILTSRGYTLGCPFGFREDGTKADLPAEFHAIPVWNGVCEESLRETFPFEDLKYQHAVGAFVRKETPEEYRRSPCPDVPWTESAAEERLSSDGKWAARLDADGVLDVWSTETGRSLFVLQTGLRFTGQPFQNLVDEWESFAFSPSGRYLFLAAVQRIDVFELEKQGAFTTIQLPAPFHQLPPSMCHVPGEIKTEILAWQCVSDDEIELYIKKKERYQRRVYSLPTCELLSETAFSEDSEDMPSPPRREASDSVTYPHQVVHEHFRVYHFSPDDYLRLESDGRATGSERGLLRLIL